MMKMRSMKKITALLLAVVLLGTLFLTGCESQQEKKEEAIADEKISANDGEKGKVDHTSPEETLRAFLYAVLDGDIDTINDCQLVKPDKELGKGIVDGNRWVFRISSKENIVLRNFEFYPYDMTDHGRACVQNDEVAFWKMLKDDFYWDDETYSDFKAFQSENTDWKQVLKDEIDALSEDKMNTVGCTREEYYQKILWLVENWEKLDSMYHIWDLDVSKITAFCKIEYDNYFGFYAILAQIDGKWYVTHSGLDGYFGE